MINDYGSFLKRKFGVKVQKISIDAGFSCPNRDGKIGRGGCIYCNNATFSPVEKGGVEERNDVASFVKEQFEKGKAFFSRKYKDMKYIAYFQSYTNTYASLNHLRTLYESVLECEDLVGISIATRPDCVTDEMLDYFAELSQRTFLTIEYGVESLNNDTLRTINRGHTSKCSVDMIHKTHRRGISVCAHLIFGLPDEDNAEIMRQQQIVNTLPIDFLKLHQLQITRGTILEHRHDLIERCTLFTPEEYIELICQYMQTLRSDIIIERFTSQSPADLLIAPKWGLKNYEFVNLLNKRIKQ